MRVFTVTNRAENGTYQADFNTLAKACDYLLYQTGFGVTGYYQHAHGVVTDEETEMRERGLIRITANDGRIFTVIEA